VHKNYQITVFEQGRVSTRQQRQHGKSGVGVEIPRSYAPHGNAVRNALHKNQNKKMLYIEQSIYFQVQKLWMWRMGTRGPEKNLRTNA